jgi:hypothetical protein
MCTARGNAPLSRLRRYFHLKVKRLTTFCASLALLQNVFAMHPGGGDLLYAYHRDSYENIGRAESRLPPPGWQRNWIRRGAKRPENPVTCFPLGEVVPQAPKGVHFHGRSPVVRFSRRYCPKLKLSGMPSTHSAPVRGKGGGASHQRGCLRNGTGNIWRYFFHTFLFSLEGKVCSTFNLLHSYFLSSITMISRLRRLFPLWCLTAPPSPRCEACHTILRSLTLPYESCSLATPQKRWDNNAPISNYPIRTTKHSAAKICPSEGSGALAPEGGAFLRAPARL